MDRDGSEVYHSLDSDQESLDAGAMDDSDDDFSDVSSIDEQDHEMDLDSRDVTDIKRTAEQANLQSAKRKLPAFVDAGTPGSSKSMKSAAFYGAL